MYELVRNQIATLLGESDTYLETFHPDMQYSDTPIAAFISENLADVYRIQVISYRFSGKERR